MAGRVLIWLEITALLFGALSCNSDRIGTKLPAQAFQFPTGIAVLHNQGFALVASSNFDLTYQSGSLRVIDLNQLKAYLEQQPPKDATDNSNYFTNFIIDDFAVSLDNFAGKMKISSDDSFAALTIRETNQLLIVDLSVDTSSTPSVLKMSCSEKPRNPKDKFPACSGNRNVVQLDKTALQFDPFGIVLLDEPPSTDKRAYVSFLRSGAISIVDIPDRSVATNLPTASLGPVTGLSTGSNQGNEGINDLAYSPKSNLIYFTGRPINTLNTSTIQTNPIFYFEAQSSDPTAFQELDLHPLFLGTETRGLDFSKDGGTLALVVLNPNMLLFLDTASNPPNAYKGSFPLGANPELVFRDPASDLLFITFDQENTVYIVNSATMQLLQINKNICAGPFDMAFYEPSTDTHWALFTCFEDDTVTILDISDPTSSLPVLAQVGKPRSQ